MIGGTTGATNHGIAGLLSPGQVQLHRQEACILEGFSMRTFHCGGIPCIWRATMDILNELIVK